MNNDLISREALRKDIEHLHNVYAENKEWFYTDVLNHIDNAPTVEPERPKGEWIKVKEERMSIDMSGEIATRYKCSECGRMITILPSKLADYPFCHCGAEMKGNTKENPQKEDYGYAIPVGDNGCTPV